MRYRRQPVAVAAVLLTVGVVATACGRGSGAGTAGDRPTVVVTTSILGDVVDRLVGDHLEVDVVMPRGADPHEFQPSAKQVATIREADVLVVNGGRFETGLEDVIASARADGVPTFVAVDAVDPVVPEGHDGRDGHDHGDDDPHFFTDPARMAQAAAAIVGFLGAEVDGADAATLDAAAAPYLGSLDALDAEVARILSAVPAAERLLVTTHDVFGPFAERYGFDVVGTVIPGGSTADGASAGALADLAADIGRLGVTAVFADTSSSTELARTLAAEAGDIEVVELYTESLGAEGSDGATYVDLVRTNARRIADALAGDVS